MKKIFYFFSCNPKKKTKKQLKKSFLLLEVLAVLVLVTALLFPMVRFHANCRMHNQERLLEMQSTALMDKAFLDVGRRIRESLIINHHLEQWTEREAESPDLSVYFENGRMQSVQYNYRAESKQFIQKNNDCGWLIQVEIELVLSKKSKILGTRDIFVKL